MDLERRTIRRTLDSQLHDSVLAPYSILRLNLVNGKLNNMARNLTYYLGI